jgi:hypothetical protein
MAITTYDLSGCAPCCDNAVTPCNPTPVPKTIPVTTYFLNTEFTVNLHWHPSTGEGDFWSYDDNVDINLCEDGSVRFRGFFLKCIGGDWVIEFVHTIRNGAGDDIQFSANTPGGSGSPAMTSIVIVSTNPLCLTTTFPDMSNFADDCTGDIFFAVGGCSIIPPCCDWPNLPATATIQFSINGFAPVTYNLNRGPDHYQGGNACGVDDGTFILTTFDVRCTGSLWSFSMRVQHYTFGFVLIKQMIWSLSNFAPGTIRSDVQLSCDPFHFHYAGGNSLGQGTVSSVTCDGRVYPFGPVGTVPIVIDAVTP